MDLTPQTRGDIWNLSALIQTLVGGILVIIGGFAATWYQARKARKIRMDERIAEQKVTVNAQAYGHMKKIASYLEQRSLKDTLQLILDREKPSFT